jgi:hypothetical protein
MRRINTTITLARASWEVLKADRELVALPVISALASIVVAATFLIPVAATGSFSGGNAKGGPVTYLLLFAMYVAMAYVTIFFNAALVHAANERLDGGDPTLRSAINGATARAGRILPWAILSATVSLILQAIEERAGTLGRIVAGLAGLAWSLVTFLVLPILVIEDVKVGDAIRRSSQLFKHTWGENVTAQVGFGLLAFLLILPGLLVAGLAIAAGGAIALLGIAVAVLWGIGVSVVLAALSGIFQTALYRYARDGSAGGAFDTATLRGAFAPR